MVFNSARLRSGYRLLFYAGNRNTELQHQAIVTALERTVSGILLMAIEPDKADLQLLTESKTPFCFVSINLADERVKSVSSDNYQAAYLATKYLISHGHRTIGLAGIDHYHTGSQRLAGYQAALKIIRFMGKLNGCNPEIIVIRLVIMFLMLIKSWALLGLLQLVI